MKNKLAIIIPSYNEVENLKILLKRISMKLPLASVIIVDDSSVEENAKLKKILINKKNTILISRFKKLGRGSAVMQGFKAALKNKGIKYIFEMDSDLAHDPNEFIRFLNRIDEMPCDLVVGSRYLPGGKIINIPPNRTIMSKLINYFLYFWLGIHLTDHTSGFRLYSRKAVNYLVKTKLKSKGFIALSEIAYILHRNGYLISEVPITWNYRIHGKSNVNSRELFDSFVSVVRMRMKKN